MNMKTNMPHHSNKAKGGIPYWKRAHHDWKFWIAVLLMLLGMAIYVKTNDLSVRPHIQMQQRVP
jgi:hypothetical protein